MIFEVKLEGNVPEAANTAAAALRKEGAAATSAAAALGGMKGATGALQEQAKAAEELAGALDKAAAAAKGLHDENDRKPAFSGASDTDFKKSKWEAYAPPKKVKTQTDEAAKGALGFRSALGSVGDALGGANSRLTSWEGALGKTASGPLKSIIGFTKTAAGGLLAYGVALVGIHSLSELTKLAIGWRGMAQLQMVSWKATMDMRRLFQGLDSSPLVRAAQKLEQNLSKSTVTGTMLSAILQRGFGDFFRIVEKGSSLVDTLFQYAVLGALKAENAWLDLRIAAKPLTDVLGGLGDELARAFGNANDMAPSDGLISYKTTLEEIGAAAKAAAEGVKALTSALQAANEGRFLLNAKRNLGMISAEEYQRQRGSTNPDDYEAALRRKEAALSGAPAGAAGTAGEATGKQLAAGIVKGLDGAAKELGDAGGRAVDAVNKGAQAAGEIHSPSELTRREVGRQLGAGVARGVDDQAPAVQRSADRSLVPTVRGATDAGAPGATPPTSVSIAQIGPFHFGDAIRSVKDLSDAAETAVHDGVRRAMIRLGLAVPTT